ncbi:unnamed protein product [Auanema sp. JU1783]|nr:unnamed protein product [Auanema sp. JU1783]
MSESLFLAEEDSGSESRTVSHHTNGSDWRHHVPTGVNRNELPLRDISHQGTWTLSSCKIDGYGIHELLDESVDKYWQSDGPQPHTVTIEFSKKTDISFIWLYLDFKNDESYTPSKIVVYTGASLMHLDDGHEHFFREPVGWHHIDVRDCKNLPIRANVVQLQVVQNHQNGRDTHIRHIRVSGPASSRFSPDHRLIGNILDCEDDFIRPHTDLNNILTNSMIISYAVSTLYEVKVSEASLNCVTMSLRTREQSEQPAFDPPLNFDDQSTAREVPSKALQKRASLLVLELFALHR